MKLCDLFFFFDFDFIRFLSFITSNFVFNFFAYYLFVFSFSLVFNQETFLVVLTIWFSPYNLYKGSLPLKNGN